MAYLPPVLNTLCNHWWNSGSWPATGPSGPPDLADEPVQAYYSSRVFGQAGQSPMDYVVFRFAAGADVRSIRPRNIRSPWIEWPSGSGKLYAVMFVDDIHKGFPNEYRFAACQPESPTGWPWPQPLP